MIVVKCVTVSASNYATKTSVKSPDERRTAGGHRTSPALQLQHEEEAEADLIITQSTAPDRLISMDRNSVLPLGEWCRPDLQD